MNRDGACKSLWQDSTVVADHNDQFPAEGKVFDVIIAGAGITGITTALLLQRAGKSVLVAEAQTIGFGTTGGTTAHLNTFVDTSYLDIQKKFGKDDAHFVAKAIRDALELIHRNVEEYRIDCGYTQLPGYIFSEDEQQSKELDDIVASATEVAVAVEYTDNIPVSIPFQKAAMFAGQSTFHPSRYLLALAEAFEKGGGMILENCRITSVDEGEPHTIVTSKGNLHAVHFIYATHIPPGVNLLHFRCAPYRSYAMAFKLADTKDYPPALVYDLQDPYHYYRTQEIDGELFFIAGGEDHKTGHEENTDACFLRLEAHVRKYFNVESVANRWSSQYFEPNDGLPYIGALPGHSNNMYVATGYGGNGMIYSAVAARLLTAIIAGNSTDPLIELFDPNRIKPVAGFANFMKESADVVGKLIGKILPKEKLPQLADLAPGEAKLAKYDGHVLAIYKDEKGELFAVNSACTHIKCDVAWNSAEKTWDCPCHGSRFSYTGEMLTAPARKDLEQISLRSEE